MLILNLFYILFLPRIIILNKYRRDHESSKVIQVKGTENKNLEYATYKKIEFCPDWSFCLYWKLGQQDYGSARVLLTFIDISDVAASIAFVSLYSYQIKLKKMIVENSKNFLNFI